MIKKYWKSLIVFWSLFLLFIGGISLLFYFISIGKLGFMPSFEELENPASHFATEVYSSDGKMIGKYFRGSENRRYIEYKDIPENVIDALIATEDVRFYDHSGIDARGLFRVVKGLLTGNTSSGGGSTISQQLAKMLFPRDENQNMLELVMQKFREWVIAVKLERSYTKEEIITMYLNKFDYLNLAVGINSAANIYFSISPDSLRVEQAAMLVGMAKNPSLYNPIRFSERTLNRRNVVLSQMNKYGMLSREAYDSLKNLPLGLNFQREDHKEGIATYFRMYLRQYMTAKKPDPQSNYYKRNREQYQLDSTAWVSDPLYGWCNKNLKADSTVYDIYADGLKIYTTLDSRMQAYAEEAVAEHLGKTLQPQFNREKSRKNNPPFSNDISKARVDSIMNQAMARTERYKRLKSEGKTQAEIRKEFSDPVRMNIFTWEGIKDTVISPLDSLKHYKSFFWAGFLAMEPQTGHVRAYVGGPNYTYFMYDMVSMGKRQVGSTIKPILYTLAMQEGLGPCDKVLNVPQTFEVHNGTWTPRNSTDAKEGEMVTLKWGLANSVNNISGWVLKQFTPEAVVQMARKMGITSYIDPVPSIFLGASEITLKEMTSAFSIFANKGLYNAPLMVTRIEDKYGNVLASFRPRSREVMTAQTAYLMTNLLQGVIDDGTGRRLRGPTYQMRMPIGGKTGTTQNHSDGWFIGIVPDLAAGVWVGAEDRSIHFQTLAHGQGANMALPIWALFMKKVYADKSIALSQRDFEKPPGVVQQLDCGEESENGKDAGDEIFEFFF